MLAWSAGQIRLYQSQGSGPVQQAHQCQLCWPTELHAGCQPLNLEPVLRAVHVVQGAGKGYTLYATPCWTSPAVHWFQGLFGLGAKPSMCAKTSTHGWGSPHATSACSVHGAGSNLCTVCGTSPGAGSACAASGAQAGPATCLVCSIGGWYGVCCMPCCARLTQSRSALQPVHKASPTAIPAPCATCSACDAGSSLHTRPTLHTVCSARD